MTGLPVPVLLCDKAPLFEHGGLKFVQPGDPCPYCGEPIDSHESATEAAEPRP